VGALADAMARLGSDPGLRGREGRAGREFARERFSAEALVAATDAMYRELLARKGVSGTLLAQPAANSLAPVRGRGLG
jgi:hypothetical protein